jgi:hypothetical protein
MSATASSATLMLLAPGAFMTTMPRVLAAGTSTLSTPVPARAMTRSFGAAVDERRGHFRGAADDDCLGVGDVRGELFGRPARTSIDIPSLRAKHIERGRRKVIGNYDFQCWNPK